MALGNGPRGGRVEIERRTVGIILLVTGLVLMASYYLLLQTYVGPIAELIGIGFCFMFLGLLTTVGEIMGIAPDEAN